MPAKSRTGIDPARTFAARHYRRIEDYTTTVDGMTRKSGHQIAVESPGTGESLGEIADGDAADIGAVVASAKRGFGLWRDVRPLERAAMLRKVAEIVRQNARELAAIDAIDCGNPFTAMINDADIASSQLDFFCGARDRDEGAFGSHGTRCNQLFDT